MIEAEYFQVDGLYQWIKDKKYKKAVRICTYEPRIHSLDTYLPEVLEPTVSEDWHHITSTKKKYLCPRGIYQHYDRPEACGYQCAKAQGDRDHMYEDEITREVIIVKREIVFDETVCRVD